MRKRGLSKNFYNNASDSRSSKNFQILSLVVGLDVYNRSYPKKDATFLFTKIIGNTVSHYS